jgi:3',5'-cyclic AMP phosphodiesterase CpdA
MRLIHITDPHLSSLQAFSFWQMRGKRRSGFLSWYKNRRHIHRREVLEQLLDAVIAESPDRIILSGDLVHIGMESEIIEAAQWLQRLGPPEKVMLIPGNHDNYATDSQASMQQHWTGYLPKNSQDALHYSDGYPVCHRTPELHLVGVNSSCVTRIFSAAGELGPKQRMRLAEALRREPTDRRFQCLVIHHPPLPGMTKRRKALKDAQQLQKILELQAPDLILYGHLHHNREQLSGHTRICGTASASSIFDASYRVFDLQPCEQGWTCDMRLMTRGVGIDAASAFEKTAQSSWSSDHSPG